MDMTGEYRIPAPREKVWAALNDPETLKASIPGCQSLDKISDTEFVAVVMAKVGPVKAKFNGQVKLLNLNPPESYTISGEGKGGAAGFAKGGADVHLKEEGDETALSYTAKADVGGKLAQLGSRLIDGTAKKMADEFFANFRRHVAGEVPPAEPAVAAAEIEAREARREREAAEARREVEAPAPAGTPPEAPVSFLQNRFVWAAAAIVVLMLLLLLFR